jgi:hypothetical protein
MLWHLPVVVELAVELGVLDEACVVQTVTTGATLHAVLVVGDVHYPQKESIVNGSATHATQRTQSGCHYLGKTVKPEVPNNRSEVNTN